jgi:thiol-disulfide isomerase/thioredoxin
VRAAPIAALCAVAVLVGGCGREASPEPPPAPRAKPAGQPETVRGLPRELAKLRRQGSRLLGGGPGAFSERLEDLRGHPVVVNKWASWCPPCRAEFPFLRAQAARRAREVAFIGVNSSDSRPAAEAFLRRFPPGYPSYEDPDLEVAQLFNGVAGFPTTAFYDSSGQLVYVKQGGYATEQKLAEDIDRYTR